MTLLSLLLPLLILAALGLAYLLRPLPDELASTRQWLAGARQLSSQAGAAPPASPVQAASETPATPLPDVEIVDPFRLRQDAAAPPATAVERPPQRVRRDASEEEDDEPVPSPQPTAPLPRLLGTLRQQDLMLALIDIGGATHRLQAGQQLPDGQGQLLTISETHIEIADPQGTRQTLSLESPGPQLEPLPARHGAPRRGARR
ncbi:hypothetical protein [Herbaspirillum seropedicae]|uniref:hypothetical protein n=1 Tax=Herbaspirillum seropedicae TaxID=964 RepID=UPI000847F71F|nr:hypothetical protein [Herbaspirillum seropedicae]